MAETNPAAKDTPKREIHLNADRLKLAEHTQRHFSVTVEQGVTKEDILNPHFWTHVSAKMQPYDIVTVRTDDGAWWAQVLVLTAARTYAKTAMINFVALTSGDVSMSEDFRLEGHKVTWRGPQNKWTVVREKDGAVVKEKIESRNEGAKWLEEFVNMA